MAATYPHPYTVEGVVRALDDAGHFRACLEGLSDCTSCLESGDCTCGDAEHLYERRIERADLYARRAPAAMRAEAEAFRTQRRAEREREAREFDAAMAKGSIEGDLWEVIGKVSDNDYCGSGGRYLKWEADIAKPALEAKGYRYVHFYDGERDSFGPLSRIASAVGPDGFHHRLIYG